MGKTKRGKGTKWMVLADGSGTPLGAYLDSASPSEVKLLDKTLETVSVRRLGPGRPRTRPERLIADRGYDSDPLRKGLLERGIRPIIPHRSNRTKPSRQDGRELRRYRRRWIIEGIAGESGVMPCPEQKVCGSFDTRMTSSWSVTPQTPPASSQ